MLSDAFLLSSTPAKTTDLDFLAELYGIRTKLDKSTNGKGKTRAHGIGSGHQCSSWRKLQGPEQSRKLAPFILESETNSAVQRKLSLGLRRIGSSSPS